ncbi:MAG: hypothetical protein AB8C84_07755 [Oligoflexales bacterium]
MDQMSGFFMTLFPLILFVIVDVFWGMKAALVTAVIAAFAEALLSLILFGEIDFLTATSILLVVGMAAVSWKTNSSLMFKMQPVLLGLLTGGVLLGTTLLGRPLLVEALQKYGPIINPDFEAILQNPNFMIMIERSNWTVGIALWIHAGVVAWTALKYSNWIWLLTRGLGVYLAMIIGMFFAAWI